MPTSPFVRRYRPGDRAAVFNVCVRTGYEGGDSREIYPDLELLPNIFAAPYLELEPDLAFVLDDGRGEAVGYIVGTADTPRFTEAFRDEWLPRLTDRYPAPSTPPTTPTEKMLALMHTPERMVVPELADHPAHLHIDLLPGQQRRGHGRTLMNALLAALHAKSVPAVHLCMSTANRPARAFYDRVGFRELDVPGSGSSTYLGRPTEPGPLPE
ncbi:MULTISPECIES: GNAT family N-acetyltransferase [unclassified Streptomyces]|uniref:GNAT family N-acetyltransferase n=1 Tax=unclassified Streptomyces TaxID=2593676 RepID=UPI0004CA0DD9|nr:GNAT family N-acetyltransferase [Streptomyces sp. NRRL F-5135]